MTLRFYSISGEYGDFSNFAPYIVTIEGNQYPTTEHFFQATKFKDLDNSYAERIRQVPRPHEAAALGRDRRHRIRPDWDQKKDNVMRLAVLAKFSQHQTLKDLLLGTGGQRIEEAALDDSYWGTGSDGRGKNRLGQILMEVRDALLHDEAQELYEKTRIHI